MDAINVFHPAVSEHFAMQTESQYNLFSPRDREAFVFGGEAGGFEVRGEGVLNCKLSIIFLTIVERARSENGMLPQKILKGMSSRVGKMSLKFVRVNSPPLADLSPRVGWGEGTGPIFVCRGAAEGMRT